MVTFASILARLREPSTFAGIAAIATMFGATPVVTEAGVNVVTCLAGLAAIFIPEARK